MARLILGATSPSDNNSRISVSANMPVPMIPTLNRRLTIEEPILKRASNSHDPSFHHSIRMAALI